MKMGLHFKKKSDNKRSHTLDHGAQELIEKSRKVVRFTGVSLAFLRQLWDDVRNGRLCKGTRLVVAKEVLADDVQVGRTLMVDVPGRAYVPYRKDGLLQSFNESQVKDKPRNEWTIADICDFLVLPRCVASDCFYLDFLDASQIGSPFEGAFVSQARQCRFGDLVNALEHHFQHCGERIFLWLDIFCANQPRLTTGADDVLKQRLDLLTHGFHSAIERFDRVVVMFDSWVKPQPLGRAWCIWELYGAAKSGKTLEVALAPDQKQIFIDALMENHESATMAIMNIVPQKATCFDRKDLEMIQDAVEMDIGWPRLKKIVVEQLLIWMMGTGKEECIKAQAQMNKSDKTRMTKVARLFSSTGILMCENGRIKEALELSERSLNIYLAANDNKSNLDVAHQLLNVANCYHAGGTLEKALEMYEHAYTIYMTLEFYEGVANIQNNMATVYMKQEKFAKALILYERSIEVYKFVHGDENQQNVASTLTNMGNVYLDQGIYDKALELYERSNRIFMELYDEKDHPNVAHSLNNIGLVFQNQGDFSKAIEMYTRSYEIYVGAYGNENHREVAEVFKNMADSYQGQGNLSKALEMYDGCIGILLQEHGDDDKDVANALLNMGFTYYQQGEYPKALEVYERAYKSKVSLYTTNHPDVVALLLKMGLVFERQNCLPKAMELYKRSLKIATTIYSGNQHPMVAGVLSNIANCYQKMGKLDKSIKTYKQSYDIKVLIYHGDDHPDVAQTLADMGSAYASAGDFANAARMYERGYKIGMNVFRDKTHPFVADLLANLELVHSRVKSG